MNAPLLESTTRTTIKEILFAFFKALFVRTGLKKIYIKEQEIHQDALHNQYGSEDLSEVMTTDLHAKQVTLKKSKHYLVNQNDFVTADQGK